MNGATRLLLLPLVASLLGAAELETKRETQAETKADTKLGGFDLEASLVPRESIVAGGPGRDGIHSVDQPEFVAAGDATWVGPQTPVLGVELGGEARAYPVHLLEYHQIVNDVMAETPIAVTFGPLAATPAAFRRSVDGRILSFGVSGLLYNSNFLMYDRETESLWSQFEGRAVAGPLAGKMLQRIRIRQETSATWLARFPDSKVLARPAPKHIDYRYSPFEAYMIADRIPFPVRAEDRRYHAKALVVGVVAEGKARAYLDSLVSKAGGQIGDVFQGRRILIHYDREAAVFTWEAPDDVQLTEAYWFAWKAFHPDTEIWGEAEPQAD